MKKISLLLLVFFVSTVFMSCEKTDLEITENLMVGKWIIKSRSFNFTTDCEKNEFIVFNEDSTLVREQCNDTTYGTWYVENEQLLLNLVIDTNYLSSEYKCELIAEDQIKVEATNNFLIWMKYAKEKK